MENNINILFAEDEEALGMIIQDSLESRGFTIDYYTHGTAALNALRDHSYHILLLDVMLPGVDGFTLAREFRKHNKTTPILFLTARSQTEDVITGFEAGGNDYIKKPFSIEELIVRIRALTGRIDISSTSSGIHLLGSYRFDPIRQILTHEETSQTLTYRENEILRLLCEHHNKVLSRSLVLNQLWGDDNFFNARSMDVFITRLRKYLKNDPAVQIVNIRGQGYKLIS